MRVPSPARLLLFLLVTVVQAAVLPTSAASQDEPTVVYLVRHAERAEDGTDDPPISTEGAARADLLAEMLRDAGVTHVHTTDYRRTRQTGEATARSAGLPMAVYDPRDPAGFAAELARTPGRHLVLGHSNTTPGLVSALGGDPGDPIAEMEYDRLYIVTLTGAGASTVLIRFGARFVG